MAIGDKGFAILWARTLQKGICNVDRASPAHPIVIEVRYGVTGYIL